MQADSTADDTPTTKSDDKAVLELARKRLAAAKEAEADNHASYVEDYAFSDAADQWPAEVKRLRGKSRPALTVNRLNGVCNQIVNDYRQNKLSIKVLPASSEASEDTADTLAGLMRHIEAQSNADVAYATALACAVRGGFGYFRVITKYCGDDAFDQDVVIAPVHNPLTVHIDPDARGAAREDMKWCFLTDTMPRADFERKYPKAKASAGFDTDDKRGWNTADKVTVAEYYEQVTTPVRIGAFSNGLVMEVTDEAEVEALAAIGITLVRERQAERTKVVWRLMVSDLVLETREYAIKYVPVVAVIGAEVNLEGKVRTRSAIHHAKHAQQIFNYFKTAATESAALSAKAPWLLTPEHIEGFEQMWANVNTAPLPYLLFNHETGQPGPQRLDPATVPIGELTLANGASDDIKATTGLYDASLGARGNETSGKAILARQQEGDTATYQFIDNLKKAIEHGGRVALEMIRVVYDAERVVRTVGAEGETSTETVNEQKYDPMTGVTQIVKSLTAGKYDVVITAGPNMASQKLEMLNALQQVLPALPILGQVAPDLIVKALPFQGAAEIAERVKRALPPQITEDADGPEAEARQQAAQQAQAAQQQARQELQAGQIQAENAKSQATVAKAQADVVKARASVAQPQQPTNI